MEDTLKSIIFFFIGSDIIVPNLFVKSVRLQMGNDISIIQLSDFGTPRIDGVDDVERYNLSEDIMIARLQAYSFFKPKTKWAFYCDVDCLFLNKLKIPDIKNDLFFIKRKSDSFINFNYPEFYPEFKNQTLQQVMPFIFGAILISDSKITIFQNLLHICLNLPKRFHRWYGDQYSLKLLIDKGIFDYGNLPEEIYLKTTKGYLTENKIRELNENGTIMAHFKGPESKKYMQISLDSLKKIKLIK